MCLLSGYNILVHCKCGLGRAGTTAACVLKTFGYNSHEAIDFVRSKRSKAIQTKKQEDFILNY